MKKLLFLFISVGAWAALRAAPYYPPSSRFGDFQANIRQGIIGGIPSRSSGNVINAATYGFSTSADAATNSAAFASALAASAEGDIISLPAGTFYCNALPIGFTYPNRTIRGAGVTATVIKAMTSNGMLIQGDSDYGSVFNPSSTITSLTSGSATITVADGSGFPSPVSPSQYRLARLELVNEATTPVVSTYNFDHARSISVVMVSRSGNTITLSRPLPSAFSAGASGATLELGSQLVRHTYGIGVEDLTIDGSDASSTMQNGLVFQFVADCWAKNVKVVGHRQYGIESYDSVGCEVRKCWVGEAPSGSSNHAGILWNFSTYGLVEDNVVETNFPQVEVNFGSTSNIFAYNYLHTGILLTNHGPHNSFNLFEGNSYWYAQSDGYFGGESDSTHFRNYMRSGVTLALKKLSRNINIIGNIVGTPGTTYTKDYSDEWGLPNISNLNSSGTNWQLSAGSYSADWDGANGHPKTWAGTLTTRTDDTHGVITLSSGIGATFTGPLALTVTSYANERGLLYIESGHLVGRQIVVDSVVGDAVTFHTASISTILPAVNDSVTVVPSYSGFQERDLDVAATVLRKKNYYVYTGNIPVGEALTVGDTIAASYAHTSKPDWFGSLAWPAYDPDSPPVSEAAALVAIPAGYRYINGNEDYLTGGTSGGSNPHYAPARLRFIRR